MAITVALPHIFIKSNKHSVFCRVFKARVDNSELDSKGVLEVEKRRNDVKTQRLNIRVFHN